MCVCVCVVVFREVNQQTMRMCIGTFPVALFKPEKLSLRAFNLG